MANNFSIFSQMYTFFCAHDVFSFDSFQNHQHKITIIKLTRYIRLRFKKELYCIILLVASVFKCNYRNICLFITNRNCSIQH